jgi:L-asparagine oxygenase
MTVFEAATKRPWNMSQHRLELTAAEGHELLHVAEQLVPTPPTPPGLLDDPGWVANARQLSCALPVRLREAVRRYRHDSGEEGTLVIANLPIDEAHLPDTPGVAESVERVATVPAVVSMLIGLQLGEVVAYREEKAGALVQNVVPVRGLAQSQSNAGAAPLEFHIENAFHPHRPDYIGLLCLRSDHEQQAGTVVTSMRRALRLIDAADLAVLQQDRFLTAAPPSFGPNDQARAHAVLDGSVDDPNVGLDFNATMPLDEEARRVLERLHRVLTEVSASLVLRSGEMVFVDNRIVLHGRSLFTPRFDGHDRWLHRVFVHLDNRRSRSHRSGNGAVLA